MVSPAGVPCAGDAFLGGGSILRTGPACVRTFTQRAQRALTGKTRVKIPLVNPFIIDFQITVNFSVRIV